MIPDAAIARLGAPAIGMIEHGKIARFAEQVDGEPAPLFEGDLRNRQNWIAP
jgi:hypothetical protein